jgi:hypothetical protein
LGGSLIEKIPYPFLAQPSAPECRLALRLSLHRQQKAADPWMRHPHRLLTLCATPLLFFAEAETWSAAIQRN